MLDIIKSPRLKRWHYVNKIFLCVLLDICYSFLLSILVEMMSEAVKMLKGEYTIRAIKQMKMDRAIIFCRTKLDCDNMENYLNKHGGGKLYFCIKACVNFCTWKPEQLFLGSVILKVLHCHFRSRQSRVFLCVSTWGP